MSSPLRKCQSLFLTFCLLSLYLDHSVRASESDYARVISIHVEPQAAKENEYVTVSCVFNLGKMKERDAKMIGGGYWPISEIKKLPESNKVRWSKRKIVRRRDNGKVIQCSIDFSRKTTKLTVFHAPRITKFSSSPNSAQFPASERVFVGSSITCSSDANPAADVTVFFCGDYSGHYCKYGEKVARGKGRVEFPVPDYMQNQYLQLECVASNRHGDDKPRYLWLTVINLGVVPKLEMGDFPQVGIPHRSSCSFYGKKPQLLEMKFDKLRLMIFRYIKSNEVFVSVNSGPYERVDGRIPYSVLGVQIEKSNGSNRIDTTFKPTPKWLGTNVSCSAVLANVKSKRQVQQQRLLTVTWPASVRNVTVSNGTKSSVAVIEGEPATILCELQLGNPKAEFVRASIGRRQLEDLWISRTEKNLKFLDEDQSGLRWLEASWRTRLSRADHGAEVVCNISSSHSETVARVLYPPRPSDVVIAVPGFGGSINDIIRCSAIANPTPAVTLTAAVTGDLVGNPVSALGEGSAEVRVPSSAASKNVTFVCQVANDLGSAEKIAVVGIRGKRPLQLATLLLGSFFAISFTAFVTVVVILIRRRRSPPSNPPVPLQPIPSNPQSGASDADKVNPRLAPDGSSVDDLLAPAYAATHIIGASSADPAKDDAYSVVYSPSEETRREAVTEDVYEDLDEMNSDYEELEDRRQEAWKATIQDGYEDRKLNADYEELEDRHQEAWKATIQDGYEDRKLNAGYEELEDRHQFDSNKQSDPVGSPSFWEEKSEEEEDDPYSHTYAAIKKKSEAGNEQGAAVGRKIGSEKEEEKEEEEEEEEEDDPYSHTYAVIKKNKKNDEDTRQ